MCKADKIKETLKKTKERRKNQTCKVFQIKIDESKLSEEKKKKLKNCFIQAKWIYNSLVDKADFDIKNKIIEVNVFNELTGKCDIKKERNLFIGSQIKQAIKDRFVQNIINLSKAKNKGLKIGCLKFKKEVNSIPLKQYGVTYKVLNKNTVSIQGIGKLKCNGLHQIQGYECANATLVKKPSGFYLKITCFEEKINCVQKSGEIGLDFGIKDSIVDSNGNKFNWNFPIPKDLKRQQRKLSKKKKGSKNYIKKCKTIKRKYEKYTRKKDDAANQFVASLKKYKKVVIQSESIKGWHAGLFGKQVQQSILGRIKSRIIKLETSIVIDRWIPTTKMSPLTGKNIEIGLSERTFKDGAFEEDRDIKSAKTILCFGLYNPNLTSKELRSLPLEEITSAFKRFYPFECKLFPMNEEALSLAAG